MDGRRDPDLWSLPNTTSALAGQQAALKSGAWRERILKRLRETGGSTLFEVARHYGVPDHTISGRFTELFEDGLIERTGERRVKPASGCQCDVWRVRERTYPPPAG